MWEYGHIVVCITALNEPIIRQVREHFKLNNFLKINGCTYQIMNEGKPGNKGIVFKANDEDEMCVAIKITISHEFENKCVDDEPKLQKKLSKYHNFTEIYNQGITTINIDGKPEKFVCFVEEWVDGICLGDYMEQRPVTTLFLRAFIISMCESLNNLKYCNLCHNDLHDKNIMIEEPSPGSLLDKNQYKFKIVDMGSLKDFNPELKIYSEKKYTDLYWFVHHIVNISNKIIISKNYSLQDERYLRGIVPWLDSILEKSDFTRTLSDLEQILIALEDEWEKSFNSYDNERCIFNDPFHFISAENIQSDKLIVDIFADSCPFIYGVNGPDPIILTGPRGCGKSTVFRRMSLKSMLYASKDELIKTPIVSFYISCSYELKNRVNWIGNHIDNTQEKYVIHLFNLILAKEILQTFETICNKKEFADCFCITPKIQNELFNHFAHELNFSEGDYLRIQGISPISIVLKQIILKLDVCQKMLSGNSSDTINVTDVNFISNITDWIVANVPFFKNKKIAFLIDDLSTRQISATVQKILGVILFQRAKSHIFKISSDKNGFIDVDNNESNWEINREFIQIDCGKDFLSLNSTQKVAFTVDLMNKRLKAANYTNPSIEYIIGHSRYSQKSLGAEIRYNIDNKIHNYSVYHGLETISELCAGDISVLLDIFRRIFSEMKVNKNNIVCIPPVIQHKVIKSVSDTYLEHIKNYHPLGNDMYKVVSEFGTLGKKILHEGKLQTSEAKLVPNQCPRIEVDYDSENDLELSGNLKILNDELIKRSIFIELDQSSTRHGKGLTSRLHLRPIYLPSFYMSTSKNVAIKWNMNEYKRFLKSPKQACDEEFKRRWNEVSKSSAENPEQTNFTNFG